MRKRVRTCSEINSMASICHFGVCLDGQVSHRFDHHCCWLPYRSEDRGSSFALLAGPIWGMHRNGENLWPYKMS